MYVHRDYCNTGTYWRLRTFIQRKISKSIYVWSFVHLLNLVVVDNTCTVTKKCIGPLQSAIEFIRGRKRYCVFIEYQHNLYPEKRIRHIKNISNTRWMRNYDVVYKQFNALLKSNYFRIFW